MKISKTKSNGAVWAVMLLLIFQLTAGCASHSHSSETRTTTSPSSQTVIVEKESTSTRSGDTGVFGGVFHVVGEILAFPFQLVADVFRFIF